MQHAPPEVFNTAPTSVSAWRNTVKKVPGVSWLRKKLWTPQWGRVVMNEHCQQLVTDLGPQNLSVLEISGNEWERLHQYKQYKSVRYRDYDVCESALDETFDLVIAEQVFEHLLWPYRAGKNVYQMVQPGGHFLTSTPFLVRIHPDPIDCSRWTETGLKHLLAECGFPLENIQTFSWGNRACVKANFKDWVRQRWWHSLRNEPFFPYVVWALARR